MIERRGGERFRLFVPQELGQYVAEVVADMARGLGDEGHLPRPADVAPAAAS